MTRGRDLDEVNRMGKEVLKRRMTQRFEHRLEEAIRAVEQAPDGQVIAASEWQIREVFQKLMAETFGDLVQDRIEQHPAAAQAAFSPCGPGGVDGAAAEQGGAPPEGVDGGGRVGVEPPVLLGQGRGGRVPRRRGAGGG